MSEIELHRKLLGDGPRNAAFHEALRRLVVPGRSSVVDIGAGTGFLSFLARRLGARHCTLIEYADTLELARTLARANGIDGLTFVHAHSQEIRKPVRADIVVSETLGNFALEEGLLETLVDARRFLAPGGTLVPAALRQFVAPVTTPALQASIDIWGGVGFGLDVAAARRVSLNNMYVRTVTPQDLGGDAAIARRWDALDFDPAAKAPASARQARVTWKAGDLPAPRVHGLALWWEVTLVRGVELSTSPWAPPTHWEQIYLPLLAPVSLAAADTLAVTLAVDTRREVGVRLTWRVETRRGGKAVAEQALDTFAGRL